MDEIKIMFEGLEKETKEKQLLNLFNMIREFDYARNGKEASIEFLEAVIEAFKSY